jgi:hypothetical protein
MSPKKSTKTAVSEKTKTSRSKSETAPKFPYTTNPASLRRLLKEIPKKPKPPKFDENLLKSWGFSGGNDYSTLRVLKAVNMLNSKNEPTEIYERFMNLEDGGKALGPEIRSVYKPLFQASHTPYSESNDKLQNLFNIHSGGGEKTLSAQIQTFKALSEFATFDQISDAAITGPQGTLDAGRAKQAGQGSLSGQPEPTININLHIHLPENKSRREYEDIIEDIGKYIFGRNSGERRA